MPLVLIIHCKKHKHAKRALLGSSLNINRNYGSRGNFVSKQEVGACEGRGDSFHTQCPRGCSSREGDVSTSNTWCPCLQGEGRIRKKAARAWETTLSMSFNEDNFFLSVLFTRRLLPAVGQIPAMLWCWRPQDL